MAGSILDQDDTWSHFGYAWCSKQAVVEFQRSTRSTEVTITGRNSEGDWLGHSPSWAQSAGRLAGVVNELLADTAG